MRRACAPSDSQGRAPRILLPDEDWWLIVAFQKDRHSRADCVRFTVNITIANKRAWAADRAYEPSLPIRPSGNTQYSYDTAREIRLGNLMPPRGEDRWWEVGPRRPSKPAATRVSNAIERFALPWLRQEARRS